MGEKLELERFFWFDGQVRAGKFPNATNLAKRFEISTRTARRSIDFMAGFGPEDAFTIANACQYVDDNDMILEVDKGEASAYRNYISQTMNIWGGAGFLGH